ncbi:MAG: 5'-deoxynucleotidase [Clostridia bacterium]|nr:5'-deoxynucleotidase [Clostridia bacterium]
MEFDFFAYLSRMRYIKRWSLMHSVIEENIAEHSDEVTVISHALCEIGKEYFGKTYDLEKVLLYALYHESSEVITGDLPTPIKYYNKEINSAYKDLESKACEKLLRSLPEKLKSHYTACLVHDEHSAEYKIVKFADKISAYIKCVLEVKSGNKEFNKAKQSIFKQLKEITDEEVVFFLKNVMPVYEKSLDELD